MILQRDEQEQQPFQLIDFNNLDDLRAFAQKLAENLLAQPCHSLRAVEERYSLFTGVAVRYCQLLARKENLYKLLTSHSSWDSYSSPVHPEFFRKLAGLQKNLAGGQPGIEVSKVSYHGREFLVRALFGGWYGHMWDNDVSAQKNHLSGAIHFIIYEGDEKVASVKFQRCLKDGYSCADEACMMGRLDELNGGKRQQEFDGSYIDEYDQSDVMLGHFLHQFLLEMYSISGCEALQIEAHDECKYTTYANGFWPYGVENDNLCQEVKNRLANHQTLVDVRINGSAVYRIDHEQMNDCRVYFNGAQHPVSWASLIDQCQIINQPELFLWPEFKGIALRPNNEGQKFVKQTVDLDRPISAQELIKIGRAGVRDELKGSWKDIHVCQTEVLPLSSISVLQYCMALSQLQVVLDSNQETLPQVMEKTVQFDPEGELCRSLFNGYLDALLACENNNCADDDESSLPEEIKSSMGPSFVKLQDVLFQFLEVEQQNPELQSVKWCKEILEQRFADCDEMYKTMIRKD